MTNTSISFLETYLGLLGCAFLTMVRRLKAIVGLETKTYPASKKIVFVKFIEQGALVLHKNTFTEAAALYGSNNIYLCTFASNAQLVELLNLVPAQNRIYINEISFVQFTIGFFSAIRQLRKECVDTAIDLEFYSNASAIFSFLSGAEKRAGYHRYMGLQNYRGDLFTHRLNYSHYVHVGDSSWILLKSIELARHQLPAINFQLKSNVTESSFVANSNDLNRLYAFIGETNETPLIVINPSLNDVLPLRRWPEENFRSFISVLSQNFPGHRFIFTGREDERILTDKFISTLNLPRALNLCGKTELRDILTLYSKAKLLLTSDSGPAHFSSLTSIHTIVLFGPETPVLYAPLSERTHVIYKSLPCSPCYNVYNNRQSTCTNNLCMKNISVEEVLIVARQILSEETVAG